MADLMRSLLQPLSHHSTTSISPLAGQTMSRQGNMIIPGLTTLRDTDVQHKAAENMTNDSELEPDISGVDEYMSRLEVQSLLGDIVVSNGRGHPPPSSGGHVRNPYAISALHEYAQEHGLVQPEFEYDEIRPQMFSVRLRIGLEEISDVGPFPSKKAAKETIAARGLELLKRNAIQGSKNGKIPHVQSDVNWIGKLLGIIIILLIIHPSFSSFG